MLKKILLATGNPNKIKEIKNALIDLNVNVDLFSPSELDLEGIDPIENSNTLEGNALIKASEFFAQSKIPSLADDTGLEVDALGGKPGVKSARYSGENATSESNRKKLLMELEDKENRKARFRTVFCLRDKDNTYYFEGTCEGKITKSEIGKGGFGYDPIFIPDGYDHTFADMNSKLKNEISHRGRAVKKFALWLKDNI